MVYSLDLQMIKFETKLDYPLARQSVKSSEHLSVYLLEN